MSACLQNNNIYMQIQYIHTYLYDKQLDCKNLIPLILAIMQRGTVVVIHSKSDQLS